MTQFAMQMSQFAVQMSCKTCLQLKVKPKFTIRMTMDSKLLVEDINVVIT